MESTPELIIFLIIGGISILAAVMMLVSENAVHSALFLVLNFACVAFLYLMLEAAFLFMVQITVYAGAIMVLFMFVIMLLGAEKQLPEEQPRFPWLTRVAVALTSAFLLTAGIAILEAEISTTEPEPLEPVVQIVNAAPELEAVDILLNGEVFVDELEFRQTSDLAELAAGEYDVAVVRHGEEESAIPLSSLQVVEDDEATEMLNITEPVLMLEDGSHLTLVIVPTEDGYGFIPVEGDPTRVETNKTARIQVVHAIPGAPPIELADISEPDDAPYTILEDIQFGEASESEARRTGSYDYVVYAAGQTDAGDNEFGDEFNARSIEPLAEVDTLEVEENTSTLLVISEPQSGLVAGANPAVIDVTTENRPAFGGPTSIGRSLFTTYMLPFQAVALLLLAAMIGAIVLTRDQVDEPRRRPARRLASEDGNPLLGEPSQD